MRKRWGVFLSAVASRFGGGFLVGVILSLFYGVFGRRGLLNPGRRGYLLDLIRSGDYRSVVLGIVGWGVVLGILGALTTPWSNMPWNKQPPKSDTEKHDDDLPG